MAVGPKPVLSNGLGSPQSVWEYSTTAQHTIGTRGSLDDGRVFYYGRYSASSAIAAGSVVGAELEDAQMVGMAVNTAAIGDKTITITTGSTAVTANEYAGGYIVVDDAGLGEGITYKIDSHPAASGTTSCVVTLVDPIYVAFAAATTVSLVKSPWADFIEEQAFGSGAQLAVGVPQVALVDSSSTTTYTWLQTWGVSAGERDDTTGMGIALGQGTTAGQLEAVAGDTEVCYAVGMSTGVVNGHQSVFLRICP